MFHCQFCAFETASLTSHLNHHEFHRNITRYYYCGFNKCTKFFQKNIYLTKHLIRVHGLQSKNQKIIIREVTCTSDERCKYICTVDICKKEFYNFYELVKHLKFHIKKKEQIVCPYSQCKNKYTVVSSFTGHMSKMHRNCSYNTGNVRESHDNDDAMESTSEFFEPLNEASTESIILSNNYRELRSEINDQINASSIEELEDVGNEVYNTAIESNLFTENVAQFYLKLECQYLLSATTIQYIITEVSKLHEETQEIIKNKLTEWLATEGISQQQIASIKDVFNSDPMIKTNEILTTNFKRKKFYKNKFDYVNPVQVIIDQQKKTSFAYVSIIETLKRFFTDKSVRNELGYKKKPGKKDVLEDFMDGNVYKNNKFFQENPDALRYHIISRCIRNSKSNRSCKKKA